MNLGESNFAAFTSRAVSSINRTLNLGHKMNLGENLPSLQSTNPTLFSHLVEHPEIKVVECYFHLESLQYHTLHHISERLLAAGFTKEHISEAVKIYLDT